MKVWYIVRPETPVEASAGEEARAHHLPLIVHATGLAEAKVALEAGAQLLVHSVDDRPLGDEFLERAKANGTVYCPTLTVVGGYLALAEAAGSKTAPAIDDPNGCVDAATRAKVAESAALAAPAHARAKDGVPAAAGGAGRDHGRQSQARLRGRHLHRDGHRRR